MGRRGSTQHQDRSGNTQRIFRLIPVVGRVWAALELYRDVVARFGLVGPWEVTLALIQTRTAALGHFGEGWAEPDRWE